MPPPMPSHTIVEQAPINPRVMVTWIRNGDSADASMRVCVRLGQVSCFALLAPGHGHAPNHSNISDRVCSVPPCKPIPAISSHGATGSSPAQPSARLVCRRPHRSPYTVAIIMPTAIAVYSAESRSTARFYHNESPLPYVFIHFGRVSPIDNFQINCEVVTSHYSINRLPGASW
jgi:hypothetical protein